MAELSLLFLIQIVVFSLPPFYCAMLPKHSQSTAFYTYLGIILFIGGFMGAVYSFPLSNNITISGGNLTYGAFMMTTILLVILERDINVIRTTVRMVITVNILKFILFTSFAWTLNNDAILNPFNTSSDVFGISAGLMILGGSLIIAELLLLVFIFERIKTRITNSFALSVLYVLCFVIMLCLDGIAFPLLAFMFDPALVDIIIGGLSGKLVMAVGYGIAMLLFLVVFRNKLSRFVQEPLVLRDLFHFSKVDLIQITQESEARYRSLVDLSPDAILVYAESKLLYINEIGAREFAQVLHPDEIIGKDITDLLHPISRASSAQIIQQLASLGTQRRRDEMEIFLPDGRLVNIEVSSAPIKFQGKHARQVVIRDSTERKANEQHLRIQAELLSAVQQAVIATDIEGIVTYWNQYATQLYGWTHAEALGREISTLTVPDTAESQAMNIMNQLRQGLSWSGEFTLRRKDGGLFHAMVTNSPIINKQGELEGIIGLSQDITERKRAESRLHASEARYRQLFEKSPATIWEQDFSKMKHYLDQLACPDTESLQKYLEKHPQAIDECVSLAATIDVNQAAIDLYEARDQQELRNNLTHITHLESQKAHDSQIRSLIAIASGQLSFEGEFVNRTMRGENITLLLRWAVLPGYEDNYEKVLVTGINITPLKKAESKLKTLVDQERTIRFQAEVLRSTAEILVRTTSIEPSLQQASAEFKAIIPYNTLTIYLVDRNSLKTIISISENATKRPHTLDDYESLTPIHEILTTGKLLQRSHDPQSTLVCNQLAPGEDLDDWIALPLLSRNITVGLLFVGKFNGKFSQQDIGLMSAFGNQISLAIDNALVHSDLEKSYVQLENAQQKIIQSARLSAMGELAAGIAHQINNPLMTVIADSHLLLKHIDQNTTAHEAAEAINRAAYRAGNIVQRLLDFARTSPLNMTSCDINYSLQQTIYLVRPQIEPRYAELYITLATDLPPVLASGDHLQDIWMNLMLNARDAVSDIDHGIIEVTTRFDATDNEVKVSISDNGTGIQPEDLARIFEPFFTTKDHGTGLGLAICRDTVRQHGGTIAVESTESMGTKFIVKLPAMDWNVDNDSNIDRR